MNDIQQNIARLDNIELKNKQRLIFDNLSINIPRNKITAIAGLESSDNLLLMQIITGSIKPSLGNIVINGNNLSKISQSALHVMQKNIGVVLSSDVFDPTISVYENIKLILHTYAKLPNDLSKDLILFVLELVDMSYTVNLMPYELSRGMKLRVNLAMALLNNPSLLLYQDPFAIRNFDDYGIEPELIKKIHTTMQLSSIIFDNDISKINNIADYIYIISSGRVIAAGTKEALAEHDIEAVRLFMSGKRNLNRHKENNVFEFLAV